MALKKILITVKTYPTISTRYQELVCTAGMLENGSWIRIYPIPFRKLNYIKQYQKYDWIEIDLIKNSRDFRPESYRPVSLDTEIKIVDHIGTKNNWSERKKYTLKNVYTDLTALIDEAKNEKIKTSLATFKPKRVLDFVFEETKKKDWSEKKKKSLEQCNLFEKVGNNFRVVRKLPYKFSFIIEDEKGKKSKMMIEDWETGALYWNCYDSYKNEKTACNKVKEKYLNDLARKKDLYLFLGTTQQYHFVSPNPFIIIGAFYPPSENQNELFAN